jgi:hypothetical protein
VFFLLVVDRAPVGECFSQISTHAPEQKKFLGGTMFLLKMKSEISPPPHETYSGYGYIITNLHINFAANIL